MSNLEASFSILAQKGVMLYILKGTVFTLIIALIAVVLGIVIGSVLALCRNYCTSKTTKKFGIIATVYRSVPEYTVTAVDIHLPGVLPLPGAVQPEAVRTDHGRDEAAVQGSGCFDPVYLFRHCRDHPRRTELHHPRAV